MVRLGSVDDDIVAIDDMSLDLVGKDTLYSVALELLSHLLNYCGHLSVGTSQGNFALGSLEGIPGGQNHISLAACDCAITHNDSCGSIRSIAIEVGTADDFSDISFLKYLALIEKWRVVAHHVVDRDASGEGNTTLKMLALLT